MIQQPEKPRQHVPSSDLQRFVPIDPAVLAFLTALQRVVGIAPEHRVFTSPLAAVVVLRELLRFPKRTAFRVLREARTAKPHRRAKRSPAGQQDGAP